MKFLPISKSTNVLLLQANPHLIEQGTLVDEAKGRHKACHIMGWGEGHPVHDSCRQEVEDETVLLLKMETAIWN